MDVPSSASPASVSPPTPAGALGWVIMRLTAMADSEPQAGRWTQRLTLLLVAMVAGPEAVAMLGL